MPGNSTPGRNSWGTVEFLGHGGIPEARRRSWDAYTGRLTIQLSLDGRVRLLRGRGAVVGFTVSIPWSG